ncbi:lysis protein [Klebsiella pneumoniae]|uniref:Lysis protein n=1 Tax=Klebsiella pneumoniae TaxID=573 RepID=A0A377XI47_KLEPN|nr:lysis protein [Klebsiella pneumoniae]
MTAQAIAELVKKFWLPAAVTVLIAALAISASYYKRDARNEAKRADTAEQQVNAAQTITANVLTTMTIFNSISEANQHAKEQIALDASGAAANIKVAVANDDCANRSVPSAQLSGCSNTRTVYVKASGAAPGQPDG